MFTTKVTFVLNTCLIHKSHVGLNTFLFNHVVNSYRTLFAIFPRELSLFGFEAFTLSTLARSVARADLVYVLSVGGDACVVASPALARRVARDIPFRATVTLSADTSSVAGA